MAKNISRKEFLKATAMSAAGIGLLGAGVLNAKAEEEKPVHKNSSKWVLDSQNVKWDEEHDIVICGYGMAGTAGGGECTRRMRSAMSSSRLMRSVMASTW